MKTGNLANYQACNSNKPSGRISFIYCKLKHKDNTENHWFLQPSQKIKNKSTALILKFFVIIETSEKKILKLLVTNNPTIFLSPNQMVFYLRISRISLIINVIQRET